jgi:glycine cleavage system T protein
MTQQLPDRARVVIVGGGVVGCSVAYHLTRRGWNDVVLLERKQLTSGTTWHAAGLVTLARPTHGTRELVKRSIDVFTSLETETGLGTGYRTTGTIHLALGDDRWEELRRQYSVGRGHDIEIELIDAARAVDLFPLLSPDGIRGGLYYPNDGRGNATDTTMSLAKGARMGGARIFESTVVIGVDRRGHHVVGVTTDAGDIEAEIVVNCTGMWGREFGALAGVDLPLQALAHYYVVTEEIPGMPSDMPTIKSSDDWSYVKDDAGNLMVGFFEPGSYPWASRGIPDDSEYVTLPEDWEHLGPFYEKMAERIPVLNETGIRLHFCGPESFTPDGFYHFGEVPGLDNYYAACGFNSIGFLSGPGAGGALADWIVDGQPPLDLPEVDPRRVIPFQTNRRYREKRVKETLDLAYDMHWPYQQRQSARGIRRSPLHEHVASAGAVFGELAGWERANWYASGGMDPHYSYSWGRPHWFDAWASEHQAVRNAVGLFDLSSFGKVLVQGRDAALLLQRISTADVDVDPGQVVYTQWLNERGGIEADVTVTRWADDQFLVMTAAATLGRELEWLRRHSAADMHVTTTDVSAGYALLPVMGPRSRELLSSLTDVDLTDDAFPFRSCRDIDLGLTYVKATRITYVGELGFELIVPTDQAAHVYETLVGVGNAYGLRHAGYHALNSLRLEKAYRSWGHDIGWADSPLEAGLGFTIAWEKPGGFVGRAAVEQQREDGVTRRLVQLAFDDPDVMAYHDEPIYRDGRRVGTVASATYGHTLGRTVALGYLRSESPIDADWVAAGSYDVEVAAERHPVTVSLRPMYDPEGARIRAG